MAEELTRELVRRSERGSPRGAVAVFSEAQQRLAISREQRPWWRRGPALALATAVVVLFVGGAALLATRLLVSETPPIATIPDSPTVPPPTISIPVPVVDVGAADEVFDLALAPDGTLWAATPVGAVRWDLGTESPTVFSEADGLGGRRVSHVAVAADGTVWATGDGWLAYYDGTWTALDDDVLADLPIVGDLAVGPDGAAWMAAGSDSLIRVDAGGATTYDVPETWTEPWAGSIAMDSAGTVWATSPLFGIFAFDGEWHHFGTGDGLPSDIVGNVAVAPDGSVWAGGDGWYGDPAGDIPAGGVLRYHDGTWTAYTTADGLLSNDGEVAIGPDGDVWVIHTSLPAEVANELAVHLPSGLSHYDGARWQTYPDVPTGYGRAGVVSADGNLWLPSPQGIIGFDGFATRVLVAGTKAVPPSDPPGQVKLHPVEGLEPVRLSTSIGEIEFTTWATPDDTDPPLRFTGTDHGVIADLSPDGTPAWSLDGINWTEIRLSVEPYGWADQAAAHGDDLFAFVDGGVGRMAWNGTGWVETEILPAPGVYRGAVGPQGVVAMRGERVYYWDGAGFTEATQPPDPSLHPEPSAGCEAPGWQSEGIMAELGPVAATDDGFVALAARSEGDWYKYPVCEPLVWLSTKGNTWTPTSYESPFGAGAFVVDLAVAGGRLVAVGGVSPDDAALWVSDDGTRWELADIDAAQLWLVAGGARGWIAVGNHVSNLSAALGGDMWFSIDGLVWDGPYERPPGWGDFTGIVGVAMLDDRIIGAGEQLNVMPAGSPPAGVVVGVFVDE